MYQDAYLRFLEVFYLLVREREGIEALVDEAIDILHRRALVLPEGNCPSGDFSTLETFKRDIRNFHL